MKVRTAIITALRWAGRLLLAGMTLALTLLAYQVFSEYRARADYRATFPPPGRLVGLGTHALHLNCMGSGTPVVVFESDLDQLGSLSWDRVQSPVSQFTRACSYDRAGIMWSEQGPLPRDGESVAGELGALLRAAGETSPYVLVGHAHGGAYARIFAGRDADAVCGMVLVDSSHPDQYARFARLGVKKQIPDRGIRPLILLLSSLGIPGRFEGPQYNMPRAVYEAEQAFLPESAMAWYDEGTEAAATLSQAGQVASLDNLPLILLASARPASIAAPVDGRDLQETWLELQRELAGLSSNSRLETLAESGHYPQFDQPTEVIEAIRTVVRQCAGASAR